LEELMIKALAASMLIIAGSIAAPFVLPTFAAEPLTANANAVAPKDFATAGDRIGRAFASLPEAVIDRGGAAAAARAPKGDFAPACASAVWPNIEAACLATADGRPASDVRTITIGYQVGDNTIVLVRIPAAEIAQR
jgi:hypothetical protein